MQNLPSVYLSCFKTVCPTCHEFTDIQSLNYYFTYAISVLFVMVQPDCSISQTFYQHGDDFFPAGSYQGFQQLFLHKMFVPFPHISLGNRGVHFF